MSRKRLVVIDGYSLLYRAFFATRYLSTSDGRPTNALFGFTTMLFILLEKHRPDSIVVALDAPGKTFRHAEYEAYKGTRRETADELRVQLTDARAFIAALGIKTIEATGYEADDVVGTLTLKAKEAGWESLIVTGDLDSLQLVDEVTSVLTMSKGVTDTVVYDPAAVVERYGFGPEYVPDFKALKGDTSDNIPGVPGIGDKGAAELIQTFGKIEDLLEAGDRVPSKYAKKIAGNEAQMRKSKWLATILRDVPITFDCEPFVLSQAEVDAAVKMLESLEFRTAAKRAPKVLGAYLEGALGVSAPEGGVPAVEVDEEPIPASIHAVETFEALSAWVGEARFGVALQAAAGTDLFSASDFRAYLAVGSQVVSVSLEWAKEILGERGGRAVFHDAKPSLHRLDLRSLTPGEDTLLAAYVLRSERSTYAVRDLVQGYLGASPPESPEQLAASLLLLADELNGRLEKEGQTSVYRDIELPLVPILARMERAGIKVDRDQLREFSKQLEGSIERSAERVYELAGGKFTIGSPKQLGEVLFEKMGLPGATKTKTGYATGVEVLGTMENPIAAEVLNWRELTKLKSTYADSLQTLIREDGRIHTTYNQTVAATGRLSSNDPNLQNIPIRTELGKSIRRAFIAEEGYTLASLDYSQIELRVLAHLCEEPALVTAFREREDVHTVTAALMFNLGDSLPTKEQRRLAKMLNYAVLYGVSEWGLAQQLGPQFSVAEAKELIRLYNERFPTVKDFTASVVVDARSKGFTTTLAGRRRYFPDIHASRMQERKYAERQAMNAPIQGTAADMLKLAMLKVDRLLEGRRSRLLLNVHDELVIELADGEADLVPAIREAMEVALPLSVPVEADAKLGDNWSEMTPQ